MGARSRITFVGAMLTAAIGFFAMPQASLALSSPPFAASKLFELSEGDNVQTVVSSSDEGNSWSKGPAVPAKWTAQGLTALGEGNVLLTIVGRNTTTPGTYGVPTGLIRSDDGGATWTRPRVSEPDPYDVSQIVSDPARKSWAWICYGDNQVKRIELSKDLGTSWHALPTPQRTCNVLAVEPSRRHVLLMVGFQPSSDFGVLYRSTSEGRHWHRQRLPFVPELPIFDPARPDVVVMIGAPAGEPSEIGLWRSVDAGRRWKPIRRSAPRSYRADTLLNGFYGTAGAGRFVVGPFLRRGKARGRALFLVSRDHGRTWGSMPAPKFGRYASVPFLGTSRAIYAGFSGGEPFLRFSRGSSGWKRLRIP